MEPGYSCVPPGLPCHRIARCGDGVVVLPELCDDGNQKAGDGCSATCKIELGYKCDGSPSACTHTTCGDKKIEGAESQAYYNTYIKPHVDGKFIEYVGEITESEKSEFRPMAPSPLPAVPVVL